MIFRSNESSNLINRGRRWVRLESESNQDLPSGTWVLSMLNWWRVTQITSSAYLSITMLLFLRNLLQAPAPHHTASSYKAWSVWCKLAEGFSRFCPPLRRDNSKGLMQDCDFGRTFSCLREYNSHTVQYTTYLGSLPWREYSSSNLYK